MINLSPQGMVGYEQRAMSKDHRVSVEVSADAGLKYSENSWRTSCRPQQKSFSLKKHLLDEGFLWRTFCAEHVNVLLH